MEISKSGAVIIGMNDLGERITASAARISTTKGDSIEIFNNSTDTTKNSQLIKKVLKSGHTSLIEHIVFNIAFCNVSAVVEQFMIEFRLASFTIKSRRYVDFSESGYYIPEALTGKQRDKYCEHISFLFNEYNYMVNSGVPKEDARFLLPYCFNSNFYCTVNARELIHILKRMLYGAGSSIGEIKALGEQLLNQLKDVSPIIYDCFHTNEGCSNEYDTASSPVESRTKDTAKGKNIELISYPHDAVQVLRIAAQITGKAPEKIIKSSKPRELEALSYTFRFNNISLSGITHLVRHRMQSVIIPSLVNVAHDNFIIPETVRRDNSLYERYADAFKANIAFVDYFRSIGMPKDILVYLGLSGNVLDVLSTMNARELMLFFKLRTCNRAQWEIRELAIELLFQLRKLSPEIFNNMGPSCCDGSCPEGKLTCGRMKEVIDFFEGARHGI